MAFIRHKVIKGHTYYYLVESYREGEKVKQRVLQYLGNSIPAGYTKGRRKSDTRTKLGTTQIGEKRKITKENIEFVPLRSTKGKQSRGFLTKQIKETFKAKLLENYLPRGSFKRGAYNWVEESIKLSVNASLSTIAHELGHCVDHKLGLVSRDFFKGDEAIKKELENLFIQRWDDTNAGNLIENYKRWGKKAINKKLQRRIKYILKIIRVDHEAYCRQHSEQFATLFSYAIIQPRVVKKIAPQCYAKLIELMNSNTATYRFMEELNKSKNN